MKASSKKKMVSYSKDSLGHPLNTSYSLEDSHSSHLTTDRENRPRFPKDLKPNDHYFKLNKESPDDVLAIARISAVDLFRVFNVRRGLNQSSPNIEN